MKANKNVISALLGIALLAMPITASAHPNHERPKYTRGNAPAYRSAPVQRQSFAPRATLRPAPMPQVNYNARANWNRATWMPGPAPRIHDRDDYLRRYRDYDRDRDYARDHCEMPAYNGYRQNYYQPNYYRPNYYQSSYAPYSNGYGYAPQYNGAPALGNGLAGLIRQRDSAQVQYQMAMQRGDRVAAKHLRNAVTDLNKRIANAENRGGVGAYGYSGLGANAYNTPYANSYGYNQNQYGYGNGGLDSLITPLLGGYVR
jgi:hypothetical protein